jgi:hypothetical protein
MDGNNFDLLILIMRNLAFYNIFLEIIYERI